MFKIDTKTMKPDIGYMEATLDKLMQRGVRLSDCNKLRDHYVSLRESLKNDIQQKYGIENPNSSKQVIGYIKDMADTISANSMESTNDVLNICYDDNKMKWTSNAEALEKLDDLGYEFATDLLEYRHIKKYAESLESFTKEMDNENLIHPTITLGKTNRINYSKPGLSTIPKELLHKMIAPYTEGNDLYSVDIKNQEPHILISMTDTVELKHALESDEGLYETVFKECFKPTAVANVLVDTFPENRVYSINELKQIGTISPASYSPVRPMTREVYYNNKKVVGIETICLGSEKGLLPNLPDTVAVETEDGQIHNVNVIWESAGTKYKRGNDYTLEGQLQGIEVRVSKAERKEFKVAWLAISYGASAFMIKETCKLIDGKRVYNYITKISGLKKYRSMVSKRASELNNVICTAFGTPLHAGGIDDPKKLKRVLLDLPIQGTGADILSLLVKRFYDYTKEKNLEDKLSLYYTVHDELIIEVNGEWLKEVGDNHVKEVLKDMLEHQINNWVPFKIEIKKLEEKLQG